MGRQKVLLVANAVHDAARREVIGIVGRHPRPSSLQLARQRPGDRAHCTCGESGWRGLVPVDAHPAGGRGIDNQRVQANPDRCNGGVNSTTTPGPAPGEEARRLFQ